MKRDLHKMTPEELGRLFPVTINAYDQNWPRIFEEEKSRIKGTLGEELALRIEHFGSTAVPGLAAKPTIDILLEIPSEENAGNRMKELMHDLGYDHILRTDSPPPYSMYVKGYTIYGYEGQCFHIHAAPGDHAGLWDRLYFRDYLRLHPGIAREYEALKRSLAERHRYNREEYTHAKESYVKRRTEEAKNKLSP